MATSTILTFVTLLEARKLTGLTRQALADLADTNTTTIYDLETGRNKAPSHVIVVRLVRAFQKAGLRGLTAEDLFPVEREEQSA